MNILEIHLTDYIDQSGYRWAVGRIMTAIAQVDNPMRVKDEISSQLRRVSLNPTPLATRR